MKIELVGGPLCGQTMEVKYLDPLVNMGEHGSYARREKPWTLSPEFGALYGRAGHRMYDHVKEFAPSA